MEALALSRLHCFSGGSVCTVHAGRPQFALHKRAGQGWLESAVSLCDSLPQAAPSHLWAHGTQVALRWNPPAFVPTGIFETHFKEPFHPRSVVSLFVMWMPQTVFFFSICWLYYFGRNKASNFHTHPCVERRNKLPGTTSWKTTKYHNIQNKIEWLFEKRLTQPGHRRDFIWRQLKRKGHYLFLHLMHSLRHWTINWHLAGRPQNYPCAISMELFCAKFTSLCVYIYVWPTYNM